MLFSDLRHDLVQSCVAPVEKLEPARLKRVCMRLLDEGDAVLAGEGVARERRTVALACDVRYIGQYHEITVPLLAEEGEAGDLTGAVKRFNEAHDRLYGYALPGTPLELVNVRAVATGRTEKPRLPDVGPGAAHDARRGGRAMWLAEERAFAEAEVYDGDRLGADARLDGPAIVELAMTTVIVPRGWRLECDRHGSFAMELR
jgi:N-methylhydantoinase A